VSISSEERNEGELVETLRERNQANFKGNIVEET